jgi:hypothetical protein
VTNRYILRQTGISWDKPLFDRKVALLNEDWFVATGTTVALLTAFVNGRRKDRRVHRETSANVQIVIEDRRMVDESRQKRDRLWEEVTNRPELPEI